MTEFVEASGGVPAWAFEPDEQLRFRDRLRSSAQLREEYAALQQRSAAEYSGDREAYSEAKGAFVRRVAVDRSRPRPRHG